MGKSSFWHMCGHFINLVHIWFTVWWPENILFQFWSYCSTKNSKNPVKNEIFTSIINSFIPVFFRLFVWTGFYKLTGLFFSPSLKFSENSFLSKCLPQPFDRQKPREKKVNKGIYTSINLLILQIVQRGAQMFRPADGH